MSSGAVLTVVAVVLAVVIALLFRLVSVLDSAELSMRRLAADVRATRKAVDEAGDLAAAVERDAGRSRAALLRLEAITGHGRRGAKPHATEEPGARGTGGVPPTSAAGAAHDSRAGAAEPPS